MCHRCLISYSVACVLLSASVWAAESAPAPQSEQAQPKNDDLLDAYPPEYRRDTPHVFQAIIDEAKNGNVWAQRYLAVSFELGRNGDWDPFEAIRWYRRAAEGGDPFDIRQLACFMYRYGTELRHQQAAADGMRKAADAGDAWATVYYSKYLRAGYGVAQNDAEATRYLNRALRALQPGTTQYAASRVAFEVGQELKDKRCAPPDNETAELLMNNSGPERPKPEREETHPLTLLPLPPRTR